MKERFEIFARSEGLNLECGGGFYNNETTELVWIIWCGRQNNE